MAYINNHGSVVRNQRVGKLASEKTGSVRAWWLPKYDSSDRLIVYMGTIYLPEKYKGKRVRFKIMIEEEKKYGVDNI